MTLLTLHLPALPLPGLAANARGHSRWRAGLVRQQAAIWGQLLLVAGAKGNRWPADRYPVRVTFRLRGTGRRGDVSNWAAHGGLKVLLDCLCEPRGRRTYGMGILVDDGMRYVTGFRVDVEAEGEPETVIELEARE